MDDYHKVNNNKETSQLIVKSFTDNIKLLNETRALLYNCYIDKLKWNIVYPNPSGIKIVNTFQGVTIQDNYDSISRWFVLSYKNQIIACARLCKEDNNGLLEIERYDNARKALKPFLENKPRCNLIELNREATTNLYFLSEECYFLLLKTIFQYCLTKNHTLITTSNIDEWIAIYNKLEFSHLQANAFKYFDSDPNHVEVYVAGPSQMKKMVNDIEHYFKFQHTIGSLDIYG